MTAIVYLFQRTIINYIKRLKEKPQKIIGPLFILLYFVLIFIPRGGRGSSVTQSSHEIFVLAAFAIITVILLYSLYISTEKVKSKFNMYEVNLLFTSPLRPQTILLYGVIKQISLELVTSVFIIYQIPNFLKGQNVSWENQALLILSYIIFQYVFCNILKLLIFCLHTKFETLGIVIRDAIKAFLLIAAVTVTYFVITGNIEAFYNALKNGIVYGNWLKFIPFIGWMKEILYQTVFGVNWTFALYLGLIILSSAVMLYVIYSLKLDFYEDMLSSADRNEMLTSKDKNKKAFVIKPIRNAELKLDGVYGAKVLFFKHINEYKKRSFFFFINFYSVILLVSSIVMGIFAKHIEIKVPFLVASGLLFFSAGFGGKIYTEISYNFIFLLPDKPYKKLFYAILSSAIKMFTDALLVFIPFGILQHSSLIEVVLSVLCYVALGIMLSYSGLFSFRISEFIGLGGNLGKSIVFMLFQFILIGIAGVIVALCIIIPGSMTGISIYISLLLYSIVLSVIFSLGCVGILENKESLSM